MHDEPRQPATGDDVAATIDRTLRREARRNEALIARVRVALLVALTLIEVWFSFDPAGITWYWRLPTFTYLGISTGILVALERGRYHRQLPLVVPFLDTAFIVARLQATFWYHPIELLEAGMELATVVALAGVLIVSGAFRLEARAIWATALPGLAMYAWFAAQTELVLFQGLVHVALLGALAGMVLGLVGLVRRAVRGEVARTTLRRLLPSHVIDGAHDDPLSLLTRPRSADATVLVTDIRGFTAWAEERSPIEVLDFLNVIQGRLAEIVRVHEGTVDKFMGDGMLAVFGAPEPLPDHAERAVAAAREMLSAVRGLGARSEGVRIGIGIHSGELVVGCLGSGLRMEFTILGDTVNTASRLESLTKERGVDVLISGDTAGRLGPTDLEDVGEVVLRGRSEPIRLWTLPGA